VYASTSGNVEFVIDTIADHWRQAGHLVETHRAEVTSIDIVTQNQLFLFGTSTWEHGELNPFFVPLYEKLQTIDCTNKSAFFVGCGDYRYEPVLFNRGIQLIQERWESQGGQVNYHPLKINNDPSLSLHNLIEPWINQTKDLL
jgi:flavodoxin